MVWIAHGNSNGDVASILDMSEKIVKQHPGSVFQKIGVESRTAASLRAVEALSGRRRWGFPGRAIQVFRQGYADRKAKQA